MQNLVSGNLLRAAGLALVFSLAGHAQAKTVVGDDEKAPNSDFSAVNKSLRVGENAEVGDLDAVNGSIRVGDNSIAGEIESVNGGIDIGAGTQAVSVESINGGIDLESGVSIERDVESINGTISMRHGGEIGGDVSSVNGAIRLSDVKLNGSIVTYNGGVDLKGDTEVFGEIKVRKSRNNKSGFFNREKVTVISIGPNVVVHGDLIFEKKVELHIDSSAKVGDIQGEEFIKNNYYK